MRFDSYDPETQGFYDELFIDKNQPRPEGQPLVDRIHSLPPGELMLRQAAASAAMYKLGATFNVYGDEDAEDRIFPFDVIPRIVAVSEWAYLERGLKQRIHALNLFLDDIYHDQKIVADGHIPLELIESAKGFLKPCVGLNPPAKVWCHITGTDLVRDKAVQWFVLEDNMRCPSGISYVLENRRVMKNTFPQVFAKMQIQPVDEYPSRLLEALLHLVPSQVEHPTVVVLTPGIYNSAYFEHSFLAQQMGIELVKARI